MKDLARRFCVPVTQTRPKGARLLEGFSPKLKRRVQLFDYSSFSVWIRLEADPKVVAFCERPAPSGSPGSDALIDFWIRLADGEEYFWIISNNDAPDLPITLHDLTVHYVQDAELAANAVWVANWQRILTVVNASHSLLDAALTKSVQAFVKQPVALGRLEAQFSCGDPVRVRACIFELLRKGQLVAPTLRMRALSLYTPIEAPP